MYNGITDQPSSAKTNRNSLPIEHRARPATAFSMDVQMWFGGVTGVPDLRQSLSSTHNVSWIHANTPPRQMSKANESVATGALNDDVIPRNAFRIHFTRRQVRKIIHNRRDTPIAGTIENIMEDSVSLEP